MSLSKAHSPTDSEAMMIYRIGFDWEYRTFEPVMDEDSRYLLDRNYGLGLHLLKQWKEHAIQEVTQKPLPHFFSTFSRAVIGVTPSALEVPGVCERLAECGELLPVSYNDECFWLFNCLNRISDVLHPALSKFMAYSENRVVNYPVFKADLKIKEWFFCIPESCTKTFATEEFFKFYQQHKMTGIEFEPQPIAPD